MIIIQNQNILLDAPWCIHCIDLAKQWKKAAKSVKSKMSTVKLAKINGDENPSLVEDMKIRGYPGIIFTMNHGTRTLTYDGKPCMALLSSFVAHYREMLDVVKYKPSALFRNLCDSCTSLRMLLLFSCVHSLGLGLDRREGENAHALIHKRRGAKKKQLLILNDT